MFMVNKRFIYILEIRSMERGICPIAVLCFALKRYRSTKVLMLPDFGSHDVVGHVTIRPAVCG